MHEKKKKFVNPQVVINHKELHIQYEEDSNMGGDKSQ